jgi:translocator protein
MFRIIFDNLKNPFTMTAKNIVAAFAIMIFMNYLANALPLGGRTTGELSTQYPNLFVPAGITFSIWGLIYLLLLGFCVLQFMAQNKAL